jgi:nicotinamidase-related amidase
MSLPKKLVRRESGAIIDKLTMSALQGTPLSMALHDCCITSIAPLGVAIEIEIEPTPRLAADLGTIPAIVEDACGSDEAAHPFVEPIRVAGEAVITDVEAFCQALK